MDIAVVTGASGFIGSHFTRRLLDLGWIVYGVDLNQENEIALEFSECENFSWIGRDICTLEKLPDCDYVFNFAAQTHVANSIENSKEFIRTNVDGVRNLLDLIRKKPNNVVKKPLFFHTSCYDEETRAVTRDGFKYYWELVDGDEVVTINPNSKKIEFKKIEKIIIQDYDGEMINFKHHSDNLLVTPNHRVFYENSVGKIEKKEAWEVLYKTNIKYPRGLTLNTDSEYCNVDGIGNVLCNDLFFVCGAFIGDGFLATQVRSKKSKTGMTREEYLNFVKKNKDKNGKFKSPGFIGNNIKNKESICYRIFFDVPESDKCRKKLENCLTNLGIKWTAHSGKSGEHIYFSSKEWSKFFEQFGKYAKNKTIPNWMFNFGPTNLKELYDGLILSDGYFRKNKIIQKTGVLTTISKNLVEKCSILGVMLGYHVRYDTIKKDSINKSFLKKENRIIAANNDVYYVHFNNQNIKIGNGKFKIKQYCGKIWCLKVPDNKNFLVERNGFLRLSGNTDEVYGDGETPHKETDLLNPSNPYSASKAAGDMLIQSYNRTYGLQYVIVRPTNNYGTHQHPEKLIPLTIKLAKWGREIRLHNHGTPKRTWLNVEDTVDAILCIVNSRERGIFNISGNLEQTNLTTVTKVLWAMNIKNVEERLNLDYERPGQDMKYLVDDSKLKSLGWKCYRNFDDEIHEIVKFYLQNVSKNLFNEQS